MKYAKAALGQCFVSPFEFDRFYSLLPDDDAKNAFLRVASFYLLLVKEGDWVNRLNGEVSVTDYLTNSYKFVGIFSLIESLAEREHQDFYSWLCSHNKESTAFPIESVGALTSLFTKYNRAHGAATIAWHSLNVYQLKGKQHSCKQFGFEAKPYLKSSVRYRCFTACVAGLFTKQICSSICLIDGF